MNSFESITISCSSTLERQNPAPYFSPYFGYKGHFDQKEKISQEYGCTHVLMIDRRSRLATGYTTCESKIEF